MPFVLPVCSKNPGRGLQILERTLLGRGKDVPGVRRRNTEGVRRKGRACQLGSWESPRKRYRNKLQEGSALFPLSDNQCFCIFFFFLHWVSRHPPWISISRGIRHIESAKRFNYSEAQSTSSSNQRVSDYRKQQRDSSSLGWGFS